MTTHTAPHGFSFPLPRIAPQPAQRTAASTAPRASLMERFAAWADRQPAHHRMGSWQQFR